MEDLEEFANAVGIRTSKKLSASLYKKAVQIVRL